MDSGFRLLVLKDSIHFEFATSLTDRGDSANPCLEPIRQAVKQWTEIKRGLSRISRGSAGKTTICSDIWLNASQYKGLLLNPPTGNPKEPVKS